MTINPTTARPRVSAQERVDFADAALGAAGHEVTDPVLRGLMERYARGELTLEEAQAAGRALIFG